MPGRGAADTEERSAEASWPATGPAAGSGEPSELDSMGRDKRRQVIGGTYGPTRMRIFATFATTIAVVAALAVGFYLLAKELDQPPETNPAEAPWSQPAAPQEPPKRLQ